MTERPTAATPVTLHRFLGIGLVGLAMAFVVLRSRHPGNATFRRDHAGRGAGALIAAYWLCGPNVFAKA